MKKTFSMILAVIMAAITVCTFSVIGFADETTTNDDPVDNFVTTTEATTKAATTAAATTAAATTTAATTAAATTAAATTSTETTTSIIDGILGMLSTTNNADVSKENESAPIVTRDPNQTYIDDGDETTAKPATTKKPAKVESSIPSTGSSLVPAVALLALAAGAVAVVKTKKED